MIKISAEKARKLNPQYQSRDADTHRRTWKFLGFGTKTSSHASWRTFAEGATGSVGPWLIMAPYDLVMYRQVREDLYFDDRKNQRVNWVHIGKADGICSAQWMAMSHFYAHFAPNICVEMV